MTRFEREHQEAVLSLLLLTQSIRPAILIILLQWFGQFTDSGDTKISAGRNNYEQLIDDA
jgi:hypothetical protein